MNQNPLLTDVALAAAVSPEVDALRAESRKWFVRSQIFMGVAAVPILLVMLGVFGSVFSLPMENMGIGIMVIMFLGMVLTAVLMLVCVPAAFYCIWKMIEARRAIQAHIEQQVRASVQARAMPPPMPPSA